MQIAQAIVERIAMVRLINYHKTECGKWDAISRTKNSTTNCYVMNKDTKPSAINSKTARITNDTGSSAAKDKNNKHTFIVFACQWNWEKCLRFFRCFKQKQWNGKILRQSICALLHWDTSLTVQLMVKKLCGFRKMDAKNVHGYWACPISFHQRMKISNAKRMNEWIHTHLEHLHFQPDRSTKVFCFPSQSNNDDS